MGLAHHTHGLDGTRGRVATIHSGHEIGIVTGCGFGRRVTVSIPDLLAIHAALLNYGIAYGAPSVYSAHVYSLIRMTVHYERYHTHA